MSQHIGPRIITGTGGSIKRVGNYRTHTFPPEIVSEDLILHFDAGNPLSYPGTGNSVIDLSGHGHNGTLTNSPSYLTQDSGVFDFDGVNSYITTGYTRGDLVNKFSLTAWFRYDGSDSRTYSAIIGGLEPGQGTEFFLGKDSGNLNFGVQDGQYTGNYVPAASHTMFNGNWHQMVYTFNNGTTKIYQDGVYKNGMTRTGCNAAEEIIIGHEAEGSFGWEGQISVVTFHTRVLLQEEITRNYNALKNRYYTYTDTFTPTCAGNTGKIELLCVAGGGGGGTCRQGDGGGGGGGAGGLIYNSAFLVNTDTSISLSVGKGGAGSTSNTSNGNSGVNSTFGSLTAIGGGGGGSTRDSTSRQEDLEAVLDQMQDPTLADQELQAKDLPEVITPQETMALEAEVLVEKDHQQLMFHPILELVEMDYPTRRREARNIMPEVAAADNIAVALVQPERADQEAPETAVKEKKGNLQYQVLVLAEAEAE